MFPNFNMLEELPMATTPLSNKAPAKTCVVEL